MLTDKKTKVSQFEDGDSARWVKEKPRKKIVSPTDKNSSVKYAGKLEPGQKKSTKKKVVTKK